MRLFIAINFNQEISEAIYKAVQRLKSNSVKGNFTRQENVHLTLAFIGETLKIEEVKQVMDSIHLKSFNLEIGGLGKFPRYDGDIYWIGVKKNEILDDLHSQLVSKLIEAGFAIKKRPFKPHLTLGRRIIVNRNFNFREFDKSIHSIVTEVSKISLMKSERLNGKLTYTELYSKDLE